jgi:excisionase family DNA binding protein
MTTSNRRTSNSRARVKDMRSGPRRTSSNAASTETYVLGDELPIVLSVPKAARLLGISKDLAYELIAQAELPAIHLGRRILVPTRRLMAFIDGSAGNGQTPGGARSA